MKTIRKGIFETNSSSTHALVIDTNGSMNIESPLVFRFGEFGWDFDVYSCPEDRASYLWTYLVYNYYDYDKKSYEKVYEWRDKLKNVLESEGIECEFEDPETNDTGYIDHGSELQGLFEDMIDNDPDKLMRYLFGAGSTIYTGNDNEDEGQYDDEIERAENDGYDVIYKGN